MYSQQVNIQDQSSSTSCNRNSILDHLPNLYKSILEKQIAQKQHTKALKALFSTNLLSNKGYRPKFTNRDVSTVEDPFHCTSSYLEVEKDVNSVPSAFFSALINARTVQSKQ